MPSTDRHPATTRIATAIGILLIVCAITLSVSLIGEVLGSVLMGLVFTGIVGLTFVSWTLPLLTPRRGRPVAGR